MSRTLQIIELMIVQMEKHKDRYRIEVTSKGICIADFKEFDDKKREMPEYYFSFYQPTEDYEHTCNQIFEDFIGGLKA